MALRSQKMLPYRVFTVANSAYLLRYLPYIPTSHERAYCVRRDHLGLHHNLPLRLTACSPLPIIDREYLPTAERMAFQPELALQIVRIASKEAAAFEGQALDQMTKDARRLLQSGADPVVFRRQMRL